MLTTDLLKYRYFSPLKLFHLSNVFQNTRIHVELMPKIRIIAHLSFMSFAII